MPTWWPFTQNYEISEDVTQYLIIALGLGQLGALPNAPVSTTRVELEDNTAVVSEQGHR